MNLDQKTAQVALALLCLCFCGSPVRSQSVHEDPRAIAASWVIEQHTRHGIRELGLRLVVDTAQGAQGIGLQPVALAGPEVQNRRVVASWLGARPSTLPTHLRCPTTPPDAQELAQGIHRGCRLVGDVEAVVQIDSPRAVDGGFDLLVVLWVFRADPARPLDNYGVDRYLRELRLRRKPTGELTVAGVGLMAQSRW
jgi:hypothetical protein